MIIDIYGSILIGLIAAALAIAVYLLLDEMGVFSKKKKRKKIKKAKWKEKKDNEQP